MMHVKKIPSALAGFEGEIGQQAKECGQLLETEKPREHIS